MTYANYKHDQKVQLLHFWESFGGRAINGKGYDAKEKLEALIELSKIVYFRRTKSLARYRKHFNRNYKGMWNLPCFVCQEQSRHRHHIIPLSHGGLNSKLNRLPLCRECHGAIHPWIKIDPSTADVFPSP